MRNLIILIAIVLIQMSTAVAQIHPADSGFKFFDPNTQALFVEALKKAEISYRVREDGTVLYNSHDEAKVSKIRLSVAKASFVPSTFFTDQRLEARFIEQLDAERIDYGVQVKGGQRWITWAERDDKRVEAIRRAVLDTR